MTTRQLPGLTARRIQRAREGTGPTDVAAARPRPVSPTSPARANVASQQPSRAAAQPRQPRPVVPRDFIGPLQPTQRRETRQEQRVRLDNEFIAAQRRERLAALAETVPDEFAGKRELIRKIRDGERLSSDEREIFVDSLEFRAQTLKIVDDVVSRRQQVDAIAEIAAGAVEVAFVLAPAARAPGARQATTQPARQLTRREAARLAERFLRSRAGRVIDGATRRRLKSALVENARRLSRPTARPLARPVRGARATAPPARPATRRSGSTRALSRREQLRAQADTRAAERAAAKRADVRARASRFRGTGRARPVSAGSTGAVTRRAQRVTPQQALEGRQPAARLARRQPVSARGEQVRLSAEVLTPARQQSRLLTLPRPQLQRRLQTTVRTIRQLQAQGGSLARISQLQRQRRLIAAALALGTAASVQAISRSQSGTAPASATSLSSASPTTSGGPAPATRTRPAAVPSSSGTSRSGGGPSSSARPGPPPSTGPAPGPGGGAPAAPSRTPGRGRRRPPVDRGDDGSRRVRLRIARGTNPAEVTFRAGVVERAEDLERDRTRFGRDLSARVTNNPRVSPAASARITRTTRKRLRFPKVRQFGNRELRIDKVNPTTVELTFSRRTRGRRSRRPRLVKSRSER